MADVIYRRSGLIVNPYSMFDVQVKRIHEYKRQLLFAFYIISQYLKIKHGAIKPICPRTFIVGGKAAPGYHAAKLSIKFFNSVADVINKDKAVNDYIKLIFLENYQVSLAEKIFPASDLSEQISTAGMEASGTGNMKFMLNGALTIGTLDGANVEMTEEVGRDNIFIFGHTSEQVEELRSKGYSPQSYINKSVLLREVLKLVKSDFFSPYEFGLFDPLIDSIENHDPFMVCADFDSYCQAQDRVSRLYLDKNAWTKKSIINVAKSGKFSSDRTIAEYARDIWKVPYKK